MVIWFLRFLIMHFLSTEYVWLGNSFVPPFCYCLLKVEKKKNPINILLNIRIHAGLVCEYARQWTRLVWDRPVSMLSKPMQHLQIRAVKCRAESSLNHFFLEECAVFRLALTPRCLPRAPGKKWEMFSKTKQAFLRTFWNEFPWSAKVAEQ